MYSIAVVTYIMIATMLSTRIKIKKGGKLTYFLFLLSFAVIMSIRSITIPDTQNYIFMFNRLDINHDYGFSFVNENGQFGIEYGFLYLLLFFKKFISINYRFLFFCIALFSTFVSVSSISGIISYYEKDEINRPTNKILIACIYISYFGLYYNCIAIRAGIAFSFILLSIYLALQNKYVLTLLLLLLAFTMHRLSVIVIVVVFILKFMPMLKRNIFIALWSVVGVLQFIFRFSGLNAFMRQILNDVSSKITFLDYLRFLDNTESDRSVYMMILWLIGYALILLNYYKNNLYKYFNVYLLGMIAVMCLSWAKGYSRITDFFFLMNIPILYEMEKIKGRWRLVSISILYISVFINLYKVMTICGWP